MTDRELLEFAAKAAGYKTLEWHRELAREGGYVSTLYVGEFEACRPFKPLTDDGAALRLAVRLGLALDHAANRCWSWQNGWNYGGVCEEFYGADPYAATRRAIVRAAAEIGRKLAEEGQKP